METNDAMNADELIEHALSKAEQSEATRLRLTHQEASQAERLRAAIHSLLDDGIDDECPPDLARAR